MKYYDLDWTYEPVSKPHSTKFTMVDEDTFSAASKYENTCCLVFASAIQPGGGYESVMELRMPIRTQEEDLYRRSDLPELLDNEEVRKLYPLGGTAAIYSPCTVSKDACLNPIQPFQTSVVVIPAVVNPCEKGDFHLLRGKVRRIFEVAADNRHEVLVLGAWGCGVFGNDPRIIAGYFCNLHYGRFKGVFKELVFAIPDKTSYNYRMFEQAIKLREAINS